MEVVVRGGGSEEEEYLGHHVPVPDVVQVVRDVVDHGHPKFPELPATSHSDQAFSETVVFLSYGYST